MALQGTPGGTFRRVAVFFLDFKLTISPACQRSDLRPKKLRSTLLCTRYASFVRVKFDFQSFFKKVGYLLADFFARPQEPPTPTKKPPVYLT
jgi:hypothetical protein